MVKKKTRSGINRKYTHFAVLKRNNKIVNGWEYKGYDPEELKSDKEHYFNFDLRDIEVNPKDVSILTKATLIRRGIDPFDGQNWNNVTDVNKGLGSIKKRTLNKASKGSKYHKISKPLGGFMQIPKDKNLIELGSMKPCQRFMFPNGKSTYTFKKFSPSNAAVYESDKGQPYKTQNLKIKVVLV